MSIQTILWSVRRGSPAVAKFLNRPAFDEKAERLAGRILSDIRRSGDRAVEKCVRQFDGAALKARQFKVSRRELQAAERALSPAVRRAIRSASARISKFAKASLRGNWDMATPAGGRVGERFIPMDRVGVYVPGGTAPLVSTALMTVTFARAAGVKEIVACTPAGRKGVSPVLLAALGMAGATEVYRLGGVQAIGAMAYGTETIRKVQKIVGPGGPFVTAAKRQVYGAVALDLVAGPSEIAVLADSSADAREVAADLLSQAEHGSGLEKALLVTPSSALARRVAAEVERQAAMLSRRQTVRTVMKKGMLIVTVPSLAEGMELCNRFAPEHLEIMTRNAEAWVGKVRCAGAVFVGRWTPECAGDFVAGPSHVLPTGGAAAMFSGLMADDFRRRFSVIRFTRSDLRAALPVIETFGRVEGLDGHAKSARIRFVGL